MSSAMSRPTSRCRATTASARCRERPASALLVLGVVVLGRRPWRNSSASVAGVRRPPRSRRYKRRCPSALFMAVHRALRPARPRCRSPALAGAGRARLDAVRRVFGVVVAVGHEDGILRRFAVAVGSRVRSPATAASSSATACTRPRRCRPGRRCRPCRVSRRSCLQRDLVARQRHNLRDSAVGEAIAAASRLALAALFRLVPLFQVWWPPLPAHWYFCCRSPPSRPSC